MNSDKSKFVVMAVPGRIPTIEKNKLDDFMNERPDPKIVESNKKLLKKVKNIKMVYGNKKD